MVNEGIRVKEVRVIDSDGSQLGIMPVKQAREIAFSKELDLVNISPKATPPVCKIMDYGKYCFELAKKEKEARKNQRVVEIKEIRLSVNIGAHDFNTKLNHAQKFLTSGHRIKIAVKFKGREMMHQNLGEDLIKKFVDSCSEYGSVDKPPKIEGRNLICFVAPKQSK
ncbi:MAG: translation initiation factor IF-3 [Oscillospiraceae bacterium]|nr:translation initiation factor IF-3 [Oscillospiraceae bacterium]